MMPNGVTRVPLKMHHDDRGCLSEFFRANWESVFAPVQWNAVASHARVLRGVHVHQEHRDYLVVLQGELLLGLCDLRRNSPSYRQAAIRSLRGEERAAWIIPPGVAHGFYFPVATAYVYGLSEYWNLEDELGCRWNDAGLGLDWPVTDPLLSERDRRAPPLAELMKTLDQLDPVW